MFGRRRVIEAEKDLAVKQANVALAKDNHIKALENIVEKGEDLIRAFRNQIASLENIIATAKDLSPEEAKDALQAAYRQIEEGKRIEASMLAAAGYRQQ